MRYCAPQVGSLINQMVHSYRVAGISKPASSARHPPKLSRGNQSSPRSDPTFSSKLCLKDGDKPAAALWLYPAITLLLMHLQPSCHYLQCTPGEVAAREQDATDSASGATSKARPSYVSAMPRALLSIDKVLSSATALDIGAVDDPYVDFLAKVRIWF